MTNETSQPLQKRVLVLNSASSLVSLFLNLVLALWVNQYLIRRLSTDEYSLYPIVLSITAFFPILTRVLSSGLGRFLTEAFSKDDQERVTVLVSTIFPFLAAGSLVLIGVGGLLIWQIESVLGIDAARVTEGRIMLGLAFLGLILELLLHPFFTGMYIRQRFVLLNMIHVGTQLLRAGLLLLLLLGVSTSVVWVLVASVGARIPMVFLQMVLSRRLVPSLRFRFSCIRWSELPALLSFGGWNIVLQLAGYVRDSSDPLVLSHLAGPAAVVTFQLGKLARMQVTRITQSVMGPLQPALIGLHAVEDRSRMRNAYIRIGRMALWLSLMLVAPGVIFSDILVELYVGKYPQSSWVLVLLLMIYPMAYGNILMTQLAIAKNKLKSLALIQVAMQGFNLGLTLVLVGVLEWGAIGAAASTLMVSVLFFPLVIWPLGWRLADVTGRMWFRRTFLLGLLPALLSAPVWAGLRILFLPDTWLLLGAEVAAGLAVYLVVLRMVAPSEDRKDFQRALNRLKIKKPNA